MNIKYTENTLPSSELLMRSLYFQKYEMFGNEVAEKPMATLDRMFEEIGYK